MPRNALAGHCREPGRLRGRTAVLDRRRGGPHARGLAPTVPDRSELMLHEPGPSRPRAAARRLRAARCADIAGPRGHGAHRQQRNCHRSAVQAARSAGQRTDPARRSGRRRLRTRVACPRLARGSGPWTGEGDGRRRIPRLRHAALPSTRGHEFGLAGHAGPFADGDHPRRGHLPDRRRALPGDAGRLLARLPAAGRRRVPGVRSGHRGARVLRRRPRGRAIGAGRRLPAHDQPVAPLSRGQAVAGGFHRGRRCGLRVQSLLWPGHGGRGDVGDGARRAHRQTGRRSRVCPRIPAQARATARHSVAHGNDRGMPLPGNRRRDLRLADPIEPLVHRSPARPSRPRSRRHGRLHASLRTCSIPSAR